MRHVFPAPRVVERPAYGWIVVLDQFSQQKIERCKDTLSQEDRRDLDLMNFLYDRVQVLVSNDEDKKKCEDFEGKIVTLEGSLSNPPYPYSALPIYIDFEDDRLQPMKQKELGNLLEQFYSLYPENHEQICYLFLDEIHTVEGWALVIRRFLNTKKVKIYLSGSSAKMLSTEIATSLRGRSQKTEIWPYDFEESLCAKDKKLPDLPLSRLQKDHLFVDLKNYLNEGGFPEVVNKPKMRWARILQDYVSVVTYRDIVERHGIENIALLKYMINFLIKNAATPHSGNKMFHTFKSQGFSVGRSTVYDYHHHIEDAFLCFTVPLFSESVKQMQNNPKKIYAIDCGLVNAHQLTLYPNYGRLFENLIYLDLRRRGDEIYYYLTDERYEVDFFTKSLDGQTHLYQVTWSLEDPKTKEREERALIKAEQELGIKGEIITQETYLDWFNRSKLRGWKK